MTADAETIEREEARTPDVSSHTFRYELPLVSVVVVNYNYADFLEEAVRSVMAQTYPLIECIIVDDCSTDNSPALIAELQARYPSLKVLKNEKNVGQSGSTVHAIEHSTGAYLVFLDADDFLLPTCVETHIITHLSLRIPVGFTSVDMLQICDGRVLTTAFPCFAEFVRSHRKRDDALVRYLDLSADIPNPALGKEQLAELVYYVSPQEAAGWPWSPTSGNCFRRDALRLITSNPGLTPLRSCTDSYLLRGVACLTGSALIDIPLVGYRLHGKNDFAKGGNLHRVVGYDHATLKRRSNQATKMLIDYLIETAPTVIGRLEEFSFYREALEALDKVHPPINDSGPSYLDEKLLSDRRRLRREIGGEEYDRWVTLRRVPTWLYWAPVLGPLVTYVVASLIVPALARKSERRLAQQS